MKFVAILSLGLSVASAVDVVCPALVCDPKNLTWTSDATCGMVLPANVSEQYIRSISCPSGNACTIALNSNSTCQAIAPQQPLPRYPGEPCNSTYSCTGSTCTNGICTTKAQGAACTNAYDCNVNMTCIGDVCSELVKSGSSCTKDSDCVHSAGCADIVAGTGKCVEFLSVAPGQPAPGGCLAPINPYCSTGNCFAATSKGDICAEAVKSTQSVPVRCTTNNECTSAEDSVASQALAGVCTCAYDGYYYCTLHPGDSEVVDYFDDLKKFVNSTEIEKCSTFRKPGGVPLYTDNCWREVWASEKNIYNYYKGTTYETFAKADKCVAQIMNPDLYTAEESAALLILAGFALLN